ncbi:MAG: hypothetical protein PHU80_04370 [Kiritimatiellae bacterium]|nr:hypothetical protein [Kiritimatiellia bacterium]
MKKSVCLLGWMALAFFCRAQAVPQTVTLVSGWNAFYLRVDPGATAVDFFADWPVDCVSLYDSAAFLRTAQYATDATVEPVPGASFLVWHRGMADISTLKNMAGDRVYVCFAKAAHSVTVYGTPCVPRMAWHAASSGAGDAALNLFGVSMIPGQTVTPSVYLKGLGTGYTGVQRIAGGNPAKPGLVPVASVRDGQVLVMDANALSDWAGPLYIAPVGGIRFGSEASLARFSVRNDAPTNRTVTLSYAHSQEVELAEKPPLLELLYKTASNTWDTVPLTLSKTLATGETWTLQLAIDRTQFNGVEGAKRAGILTVDDADGGSLFRAHVPVSAVGGAEASIAKSAWPAGLWVVQMKMEQVSQIQSDTAVTDGVAAGGRMALRTILHVDLDGNMKLLQRVLLATSEASGGKATVSLHLSDESVPAGAGVMRLSTVDMGVDNPCVAADSGTFLDQARFSFTVGERDRSNPFRHPYHPDHDGLRWDFSTPTPSGDTASNYIGTVKPETFSVSNAVTFVWSENASAIAVWDPSETLTGTCRWALSGLRREGVINVDGTFTMRRVSTVGALTP